MREWEPGDAVFVFGFSRGAYTARLLAAVLHASGSCRAGNENLIPYVLRLFKGVPQGEIGAGRRRVTSRSATIPAQPSRGSVPEEPDDRRFHVHFLGLWDTVSSVGWVWDPPSYPFHGAEPERRGRVARGVDSTNGAGSSGRIASRRAEAGQPLHEAWFPGVHSDVGGGYPEADGGLWRTPFRWVLEGVRRGGLLDGPAPRFRTPDRGPHPHAPPAEPCAEPKRESLHGVWWLRGALPEAADFGTARASAGSGPGPPPLDRRRRLIHACALQRLRTDATYVLPTLSARSSRRCAPLPAGARLAAVCAGSPPFGS